MTMNGALIWALMENGQIWASIMMFRVFLIMEFYANIVRRHSFELDKHNSIFFL